MADKITIYDLLTKSKVSETTIAQLNSATKHTAITPDNVDFWSGIITVSRAIEESRTYGDALPIPELSSVGLGESIAAGNEGELRPTGTEIYQIQAISAQANGSSTDVEVYLTDGAKNVLINSGVVGTAVTPLTSESNYGGPIYLTNSLYLLVKNTHGSNLLIPSVAYHKVGL